MPVIERRATLQDRYWFDCYCSPCQDEWPLFNLMDSTKIKIGCQTENCPFEFVLYKDDFCPYIECDYCHSVIKSFPVLRGLSVSTFSFRRFKFIKTFSNWQRCYQKPKNCTLQVITDRP